MTACLQRARSPPLIFGSAFIEMESIDLWSQLAALGQVIAIDLVPAGDNAIVVGMTTAGVPMEQRRR
jgi:predicted tellurium resistance membrane protein TerC